MIDHVSIVVSDLARSTAFYDEVLKPLGLVRLVARETTVGYGKKYPEFWINLRQQTELPSKTSGAHVCLRGASTGAVEAFHENAIASGGADDGEPGMRPEYSERYFAAFIRDPDGNRIEAVTFV